MDLDKLLSDWHEGLYGTDPAAFDTDLDGYHDGFEWILCDDDSSRFEISFYEDAGGTPGTVVSVDTVYATVTNTGLIYHGLV